MRTSTNANVMRDKNRKLILNIIRQHKVSRADISSMTSLTRPAVSQIIDELIKDGLIKETPGTDFGVGRRPILLSLREGSKFFAGIYIGRKECHGGIVDILGNEIMSHSIKTDNTPEKCLNKLLEKLNSMIETVGRENVFSLSIAAPGPISKDGKHFLNVPNFCGWEGFGIFEYIKQRTDLPVFVMKDAGAKALSEMYFGVGKEVLDFAEIMVSNGIGAGIIINGKLSSEHNEIGHTCIDVDGEKCSCSNVGCLEMYASVPSMLRGTKYSSWSDVVDKNDEELIRKEAKYLSCAIINVINLYNTDTVILSGDISYKCDKILSMINEFIKGKTITKKDITLKAAKINSKVVASAAIGVYNFYN